MFYYKFHRACGKTVLAACDSELLGKKFEEGAGVLDVKKDFYGGQKIGSRALELFGKADIINIAGSKIISLAVKNSWISKSGVKKVKGVPHAQIFVL